MGWRWKIGVARYERVDVAAHTKSMIPFESLSKAEAVEQAREFLRDTFLACEVVGVQAWLSYGGLLSLVRDGSIVSYDRDYDVGLFRNDRLEQLKVELEKRGLECTRYFKLNGKLDFVKFRRGAFTLDVYTMNEKHGLLMSSWYNGHVERVEAEPLQEPVSYSTNGITIQIPENAELHLSFLYGTNWRIPDPNWYALKNLQSVQLVRGRLPVLLFYAAKHLKRTGALQMLRSVYQRTVLD